MRSSFRNAVFFAPSGDAGDPIGTVYTYSDQGDSQVWTPNFTGTVSIVVVSGCRNAGDGDGTLGGTGGNGRGYASGDPIPVAAGNDYFITVNSFTIIEDPSHTQLASLDDDGTTIANNLVNPITSLGGNGGEGGTLLGGGGGGNGDASGNGSDGNSGDNGGAGGSNGSVSGTGADGNDGSNPGGNATASGGASGGGHDFGPGGEGGFGTVTITRIS